MFLNLPNQTPTPNDNNLTSEANEYIRLYNSLNRSNGGKVDFISASSGKKYSTDDYPLDKDVFDKGQTGLMNLLYKYVLKSYILNAEILNNQNNVLKEYFARIIASNWSTNAPFHQIVQVDNMVSDGLPLYDLRQYDKFQMEEFVKITKLETRDGNILLEAKEQKPTKDIDIRISIIGSMKKK